MVNQMLLLSNVFVMGFDGFVELPWVDELLAGPIDPVEGKNVGEEDNSSLQNRGWDQNCQGETGHLFRPISAQVASSDGQPPGC